MCLGTTFSWRTAGRSNRSAVRRQLRPAAYSGRASRTGRGGTTWTNSCSRFDQASNLALRSLSGCASRCSWHRRCWRLQAPIRHWRPSKIDSVAMMFGIEEAELSMAEPHRSSGLSCAKAAIVFRVLDVRQRAPRSPVSVSLTLRRPLQPHLQATTFLTRVPD